MVTDGEVRETLDDRPDLEPVLEAAIDAEEPFAFDDLDVDSGRFGEVVAAGIVVQSDGGYRVADRASVERALAGDADGGAGTGDRARGSGIRLRARGSGTGLRDAGVVFPDVDRRAAAALAGAVLLVVAVRLVSVPAVFRDGVVVLSGNDPYFYRYWVEHLALNPDVTLSSGLEMGEPLLIATLWAVAELFGGSRAVVGRVMAWYPVASAVVTALLLYVLAVEVTVDRRVGLAAVALLAVVPGHAMRTSLGFADHHAFDYPWLALTALSLVVLVGAAPRSHRTVLGVGGLAAGVAGQSLAWDASPLLLVPVGLSLAAWSVLAVGQGDPPVRRLGPALVGVALGAGIAWAAHATLGWQTSLVAAVPAFLLVGGAVSVALAAVARRFDLPAWLLVGGTVAAGIAGLAAIAVLRPGYWSQFASGVTGRLLRQDPIAETQTLFGESFGWLLLFGFVLVLAVPYLAWGTHRALTDARWAPAATYGWYLLLLATIQIRFVGELATFAALFAGLGFVHLAERVDVSRPPAPFSAGVDGTTFAVPDGRQLAALAALFLLVGGLGAIQVPVKTNQLTVPAEQYETAAWMAGDSDRRGWEYPENYALSAWSRNRVYNYFVSGESRSYGYARANYEPFVTSDAPGEWYRQLRDRTGYVVYAGETSAPGTVGARLAAYGSRTGDAPGLGHYRAVHVSDGGTYRVFTLVPGATITGSAEPNATVDVSTEVRIAGAEFTYERRPTAAANGTYRVTVPYPGRYDVGGERVRVTEAAVANGSRVPA